MRHQPRPVRHEGAGRGRSTRRTWRVHGYRTVRIGISMPMVSQRLGRPRERRPRAQGRGRAGAARHGRGPRPGAGRRPCSACGRCAPRARPVNVGTFHTYFEGGHWGYKHFFAYVRSTMARTDRLIAVSEACVTALRPYFGDRPFEIIPNGVDTDLYRPLAGRGARPPGPPRILFVGRFDPRNGLRHPARGGAHPEGRGPRLRGPGGRRRADAADVPPPGARASASWDRDRVARAARQGAAARSTARPRCSPRPACSRRSGSCCWRRMASGTPVVCADNVGFRQVIRDGAPGRFVHPARPAEPRRRASPSCSTTGELRATGASAAGGSWWSATRGPRSPARSRTSTARSSRPAAAHRAPPPGGPALQPAPQPGRAGQEHPRRPARGLPGGPRRRRRRAAPDQAAAGDSPRAGGTAPRAAAPESTPTTSRMLRTPTRLSPSATSRWRTARDHEVAGVVERGVGRHGDRLRGMCSPAVAVSRSVPSAIARSTSRSVMTPPPSTSTMPGRCARRQRRRRRAEGVGARAHLHLGHHVPHRLRHGATLRAAGAVRQRTPLGPLRRRQRVRRATGRRRASGTWWCGTEAGRGPLRRARGADRSPPASGAPEAHNPSASRRSCRPGVRPRSRPRRRPGRLPEQPLAVDLQGPLAPRRQAPRRRPHRPKRHPEIPARPTALKSLRPVGGAQPHRHPTRKGELRPLTLPTPHADRTRRLRPQPLPLVEALRHDRQRAATWCAGTPPNRHNPTPSRRRGRSHLGLAASPKWDAGSSAGAFTGEDLRRRPIGPEPA